MGGVQGTSDLSGMVDELQRRARKGVAEVRAYLASPEGKRLRRRTAQVLILTAPFLARSKFLGRSPVGKAIGLLGGAALIVKLAEALRDWEPEIREAIEELTD
jgi:hypothetical protein